MDAEQFRAGPFLLESDKSEPRKTSTIDTMVNLDPTRVPDRITRNGYLNRNDY